jgi:hypothetical protein
VSVKVVFRSTTGHDEEGADEGVDRQELTFDTAGEAAAFIKGVHMASAATHGWINGLADAEIV